MYNKKEFNQVNDKKVLHKIKKRWVTISLSLLMMIGGGAAATHVANADASSDNTDNVAVESTADQSEMNRAVQSDGYQPGNAANASVNASFEDRENVEKGNQSRQASESAFASQDVSLASSAYAAFGNRSAMPSGFVSEYNASLVAQTSLDDSSYVNNFVASASSSIESATTANQTLINESYQATDFNAYSNAYSDAVSNENRLLSSSGASFASATSSLSAFADAAKVRNSYVIPSEAQQIINSMIAASVSTSASVSASNSVMDSSAASAARSTSASKSASAVSSASQAASQRASLSASTSASASSSVASSQSASLIAASKSARVSASRAASELSSATSASVSASKAAVSAASAKNVSAESSAANAVKSANAAASTAKQAQSSASRSASSVASAKSAWASVNAKNSARSAKSSANSGANSFSNNTNANSASNNSVNNGGGAVAPFIPAVPNFPVVPTVSTAVSNGNSVPSESANETAANVANNDSQSVNDQTANVNDNNSNVKVTTRHTKGVARKPVNKSQHYLYFKVIKGLMLHTSPRFTRYNGVKALHPNQSTFRIQRIVKRHGRYRYEVRINHRNYYVTANRRYVANAYVQKGDFKRHHRMVIQTVRPVIAYRSLRFTRRHMVRHYRAGSILRIKRVLAIGKGGKTRLQLKNGRYVTANLNFVKVIK